MKKVWLEIRMFFAGAIMNMWCSVYKYMFKHYTSFNKTVRKFAWDRYVRWLEHFLSLYDRTEDVTTE